VRRSILIATLVTAAVMAAPSAHAQAPAYEIPPDNPFVATSGARGEIYVYGLRNPFRWSFDRTTGDMLIGDVGGGEREEVDFLAKGSIAARNLGWSCREGTFPGPNACTAPGAVEPAYDYDNPGGRAIIGGHVVRDPELPSWQGRYLFGDIGDPAIRWLGAGAAPPATATGLSVDGLSSISQDGVGRLYTTALGGAVARLTQTAGGDLESASIGSFATPMQVAGPPGDPDRLFVAERGGGLKLRVGGEVHDFLTVQTTTDGERGLLSVAVAPDYAASGRVYVFYTDTAGNLQLDEFRRSAADATRADPATRRPLLTIPHTDANNHNGGTLQFGQDGYLYLSTGDGGSQGDPGNDAQRLDSLLGKVLRLDVIPDGAPPTPQPRPPLRDVTAPTLKLRVAKRQRALRNRGVIAYGRCDEACTLTLGARLRIGKRSYKLRSARRTPAANQRVRLKARLTAKQVRALRRAVRRGKRPKLRLTLTAVDAAKNGRVARRTVRVRR
jgi:glucose/arabinose dehydrogenase